jgi:hypothetical protein
VRHLITAGSDFEAEIICSRLREAGIEPVREGEGSRGLISRDVYVEDGDLERAQGALEVAEGVSEEELIRLSEGLPATDADPQAPEEPESQA